MPYPSINQYGAYDNKSHVASLSGGSSANKAGFVIQNSSASIIVDKYSGYNVVVYRHNDNGTLTSDYLGGEFSINSAAVGSGITLSTNNACIDMDDADNVQQVLNALAGKLTYAAYVSGEDNLQGKVQIAEGLTASSAAQKVGNIVFDKDTGKGTNVDGAVEEEPDEGYTTTITGNADADTQYADVILQSTPGSGKYTKGAYKFSGDTEITVSDKGNAAVSIESNAGGWNTEKNKSVQMALWL